MQTDISDLNQTTQDTSGLFSPLFKKNIGKSVTKRLDLSVTLLPNELNESVNDSPLIHSNFTLINESAFNLNRSENQSEIDAVKSNLENLYVRFFEIWQAHHNDLVVNIKELSTACFDTLSVFKELSEYRAVDLQEKTFIENEYNTWCLVHILYSDRLQSQPDYEVSQYFGVSEKLCALNLFQRDSLLRESQLVIDWLEAACAIRDDDTLHFQNYSSPWENTLHQLKSKETMVFKSTREIVKSLDPDVQYYENVPFHDLDMEDDKKLCKRVFQEIRCGRLSNAQKHCIDSGHAWRAAQLEGWRLHHNPASISGITDDKIGNEDELSSSTVGPEQTEKSEGNTIRDIWKATSFDYCEMEELHAYERASLAAYCGHLKSLLAVAENWEDELWSYMKIIVDVRVESELRDCVSKKYKPLPQTFWEQRFSIGDIFHKLDASRRPEVSQEANKVIRIIQKHIILDEIEPLFNYLDEFIEDVNVTTQFLRFLVHLALFLENVGTTTRRDVVEKLLECYVKRLSDMNETQLLAFYVSKINSQAQINLYAAHLENILDNESRKAALTYAEDNSLNVYAISKLIVENIRRKPHKLEQSSDLQGKVTEMDELQISSLDWVLFYETQRLEALIQSNALIFTFLTLKKLDAAQMAFNKIPANAVEYVMSEGDVSDGVNQIIKEHLSYKAYLDAQRAFNSWFKQFKMKPSEPESVPETAQFTEKVAHQHRMSQFKAETERWKLTMSHLTKTTKTFLYNVLLFPEGGWLHGTKDGDYLRCVCIPECALLLYNVLSESNLHEECVQLADVLASEKHGLYKVYQKDKLGEILINLAASSSALLKEKKDPWGNSTTI